MSYRISSQIQELKDLWALLFPGAPAPDNSQWALWFLRHNEAIVRQGLVELATKYHKLNGAMGDLYMAKFASAVMNRLSKTEVASAARWHYGTQSNKGENETRK